MHTWGPLGQILMLAVSVCIAGAVLWVVGAVLWIVGMLWKIGSVLGALGWPLVVVALLLVPAGGLLYWRLQPTSLASLPPTRLSAEQFCDQCGSRLVAGFCPYCDGV